MATLEIDCPVCGEVLELSAEDRAELQVGDVIVCDSCNAEMEVIRNGEGEEFELDLLGVLTTCPIKGTARYFHVRVGDALNVNAAWTYPDPTPGAEGIRDHIAFWKGVEVA